MWVSNMFLLFTSAYLTIERPWIPEATWSNERAELEIREVPDVEVNFSESVVGGDEVELYEFFSKDEGIKIMSIELKRLTQEKQTSEGSDTNLGIGLDDCEQIGMLLGEKVYRVKEESEYSGVFEGILLFERNGSVHKDARKLEATLSVNYDIEYETTVAKVVTGIEARKQ